jgi:hypothetical protein
LGNEGFDLALKSSRRFFGFRGWELPLYAELEDDPPLKFVHFEVEGFCN